MLQYNQRILLEVFSYEIISGNHKIKTIEYNFYICSLLQANKINLITKIHSIHLNIFDIINLEQLT
jgi:hypothetical protein